MHVPDVWHVVELRHDVVPVFWADITIYGVDLRGEVAEDDDGGLVRAKEEGADEQLKVLKRVLIVICVKLDDDHVCHVGEVVRGAVAKVV